MARLVLEKHPSNSAHSENLTAEDDFALVLECIDGEAVPEDLISLARKLEDAVAEQKQRRLPN